MQEADMRIDRDDDCGADPALICLVLVAAAFTLGALLGGGLGYWLAH